MTNPTPTDEPLSVDTGQLGTRMYGVAQDFAGSQAQSILGRVNGASQLASDWGVHGIEPYIKAFKQLLTSFFASIGLTLPESAPTPPTPQAVAPVLPVAPTPNPDAARQAAAQVSPVGTPSGTNVVDGGTPPPSQTTPPGTPAPSQRIPS